MRYQSEFLPVIPLLRVGCIRVTHPCAGRRQSYCYNLAAPRLACVKPVASVHPEPGSNSPLLFISFFSFFSVQSVNQNKYQLQDPGRWLLLTEGSRPLPSSCILSHNFNVLCSPLKGKAVTKVQPFYLTTKFFAEKIFKPPQQLLGAVAPSAFASAKVETFILTTKFFRDFFML